MRNTIEVGDIVMVDLGEEAGSIWRAQVIAKPSVEGDAWRIRDQSTGQLIYVQRYASMRLMIERPEVKP